MDKMKTTLAPQPHRDAKRRRQAAGMGDHVPVRCNGFHPHSTADCCYLVAGCATHPDVTYSQKEVFDVLEVALRSRLATMPLPRHSLCYVVMENTHGAVASFAGRFPEYRMIVKGQLPGELRPPGWYYMRLGRTTHDDAWVLLEDAAGAMGYHLRREVDGGWSFLQSGRC